MFLKNRPLASDFTIVLGLIVISCMVLAVVLGNWIAEENWFLLGITLCIAIGAIARPAHGARALPMIAGIGTTNPPAGTPKRVR